MQKKLWFAALLPALFVACPAEHQNPHDAAQTPPVTASAEPEKVLNKAAVSLVPAEASHIPAVEQALQQVRDDEFLRERRLRRARLP